MSIDLAHQPHVHFVGVGGIGMSALARFLLARGHVVSGSDREMGEQARALHDLGARVLTGHDPDYSQGADLVVITSAVGPDNSEVEAARARGTPVVKRAELLAAILNAGRGVAVAGTHGKTTTSALIAHLLTETGMDPTVLIGGISLNSGSNARVGGDLVVAEADEYDASFLQLHPEIGVITNVEAEHLDFYGSAEAVHTAFRTFAQQVRGTLIVCADDPALAEIGEASNAVLRTYGLAEGEWRAADTEDNGDRTTFTLVCGQDRYACALQLAGAHNVQNAVAALCASTAAGAPLAGACEALGTFQGVARRLEVKGAADGVLVIDDYAHHPTEIRATLAAIRDRWRRPLRLVFQPHTYSRTHAFLSDFAEAFEDADAVYLLDIYAARETNILGISGADLARAAERHHPRVEYVETADRALERVAHDARPGEVIVTMGAGDVYLLGPRLLSLLETGARP